MPKGPFLPSDFTATKFSTAADKAEFGNTFVPFNESEWASAFFTKSLYNRISMCFGHIAHYNRAQFYEEWFSSLAHQMRFLKHTFRFPCYGGPEYTFSDVERAIQREAFNRNYLRCMNCAWRKSNRQPIFAAQANWKASTERRRESGIGNPSLLLYQRIRVPSRLFRDRCSKAISNAQSSAFRVI